MKKIGFIAIALAGLLSCKKDYTCSCTQTYSSSIGNSVIESEFIIKNATKNQAESACVEATIVADNGSNGTSTKQCKLNK